MASALMRTTQWVLMAVAGGVLVVCSAPIRAQAGEGGMPGPGMSQMERDAYLGRRFGHFMESFMQEMDTQPREPQAQSPRTYSNEAYPPPRDPLQGREQQPGQYGAPQQPGPYGGQQQVAPPPQEQQPPRYRRRPWDEDYYDPWGADLGARNLLDPDPWGSSRYGRRWNGWDSRGYPGDYWEDGRFWDVYPMDRGRSLPYYDDYPGWGWGRDGYRDPGGWYGGRPWNRSWMPW